MCTYVFISDYTYVCVYSVCMYAVCMLRIYSMYKYVCITNYDSDHWLGRLEENFCGVIDMAHAEIRQPYLKV